MAGIKHNLRQFTMVRLVNCANLQLEYNEIRTESVN